MRGYGQSVVTTTATRARVRRDILKLAHRGLNVHDFARAATKLVRQAVPFDGTCLLTLDPATLLPTGEVVENGLPAAVMSRLNEIELQEQDFNKFAALARGGQRAASLSRATAGELDRSLRQRELRRPSGFEDELRAALSDATGTWGALTLLRESRGPHFTPAEERFLASLAVPLAEGLRLIALFESALSPDVETETGLLIVGPGGSIETANRAAGHWLGELGFDGDAHRLPVVIRSVANRARYTADEGTGLASARLRTPAGQWLIVRGSVLGDGPDRRIAILVEPARPPELAPLIADAYGLTRRERLVTELVARGYSTSEIAQRLHLSAYTIQDHLKSIFGKTGTGSRGDLVGRLFFDHYAPRLTQAKSVPPSSVN
jgi:DNA-binding CsgD family transcriptional regulator